MVAGSRRHLQDDTKVKRSFIRGFLAFFSSFIIGTIVGVDIKDTQCGFKLFTRNTYRRLFSTLHIERWAFDVELFFLCKELGIPSCEVAVTWHEVDGTKLNIVSDSLKMARDFVLVRVFYLLRLWRSSDRYTIPKPK